MRRVLLNIIVLYAVCISVQAYSPCAGASVAIAVPDVDVVKEYEQQQADSIRRAEEEADAAARAALIEADSIAAVKLEQMNREKPMFDVRSRILDRRHYYKGDDFEKGFWKHIGVNVGAGVEQITPPDESYQFEPLTLLSLGISKDFNPRHTLRLGFTYGFGHLNGKDITVNEYIGRLDYLFNLSSYFNGYRPDRLLNISTLFGVGYTSNKMGKPLGTSSSTMEAHAGLQFKFFAGPKAAITLEPYVKLASDSYDMSAVGKNWRKYDFAYGAYMNFIYYFNTNLSTRSEAGNFRVKYDKSKFVLKVDTLPSKNYRLEGHDLYEAKMEQINDPKLRRERNDRRIFADGEYARQWRSPLFFDFGFGFNAISSEQFSVLQTTQPAVALSVGKWLSSAAGLRLTGFASYYKWRAQTTPQTETVPSYDINWYGSYYGVNLEGVINVFGIKRNYNWQSPVGANILLGLGVGRINKFQDETDLRCTFASYSVGLQAWCRIVDDVRFFVEPSYSRYTYRIPYTNVNFNKKFSEKSFTLRMGVSMLMNDYSKHRKPEPDEDGGGFIRNHLYVGLGGGFNTIFAKSRYVNGSAFNFNLYGRVGYKFNYMHGVMLDLQYLKKTEDCISDYYDYNPEYNILHERVGLWRHHTFVGFVSLDYTLSLTSLMAGYSKNNKWDVDLRFGPTVALRFGAITSISEKEHATLGNQRVLKEQSTVKSFFGANAGLDIRHKFSRRISAFLTPTIFYLPTNEIYPAGTVPGKIVQITFNLGAQYNF